MMSFGWRPNQSCYVPSGKQAATDQQVGACQPAPTWFYLLLGLAVIGGMSHRGR
jgi:hypothetical protein